MEPKASIREHLGAAVCALLGGTVPATAEAVDFDASLLYYSEGSRVTVNETVLDLRKPLAGERVFSLGLVVDVMTGASPNGAVPSREPQTFTRPSGQGGYVVLPGEVPMDDTFQDNRVALTAGLEAPLGRRSTAAAEAHYSIEYDYLSAGAGATITRDFNKRNTTVAAGGAFSYDLLSPEGGTPVPFASMLPRGEQPPRAGRTDDKIVVDLLAGVTQVIDRSTIARFNYSLNRSSGYHTDPFKMLSVVDVLGDPIDYVFERRPRERTRHSFYSVVKRQVAGDVAEASYRYMRDDWGVRSHTAEARYRWRVGARRYVQPQYRLYRQSAADFFVRFLREGDARPEFASADYRLAEFDAHTFALRYGVTFDGGQEVNVRVGYYLQMGRRGPPGRIGALRDLDLFPDVGAYLVQVGYSRRLE
jgi:hypothetical protein